MKKYFKLFILIFLISMNQVYATSGALVSSSIKTCPDGKKYGYHGSPRHWHEAEYTPREKGSNYSAIGSPIYDDPCKATEEIITNNDIPNENTTNNNTYDNNEQIIDNNNIDDSNINIDNVDINNNTEDDNNNLYEDDNEINVNDINDNEINNDTLQDKKEDNYNYSSTNEIDNNDNEIDNNDNEIDDNESDIFDAIIGLGIIGASIAAISQNKEKIIEKRLLSRFYLLFRIISKI